MGKYLSDAEFARALQVSPQNLQQYLNGDRRPGNKMQKRLKELGCNVTWLFTGLDVEDTINVGMVNKIMDFSQEYQINLAEKRRGEIINFLADKGVETVSELYDIIDHEKLSEFIKKKGKK